MKVLVVTLFFALPSLAYAHGNVFESTDLSVSEALQKFQAEEDGSIVQAYKGVRAWPSGAAIKVRMYFGDNESLLYSCEREHSDGDEQTVCTKI